MKRTTVLSLVFAAGTWSTSGHAQSIKGSDTFRQLTLDVLAACPAAAGIHDLGGGSGSAENALAKNQQQIAPMSRFLASNTAVCDVYTPDTISAEGIVVAGAKLSVLVNEDAHKSDCDPGSDLACLVPNGLALGPTLGGVTGSEWRQVLRLIYFGVNSSAGANPQRLAGVRNCLDPERVALVSSWGNLFKNPSAACSAGETSIGGDGCTRLRHAFRRDEGSRTTNAFRGFLSISSREGNAGFPFCNEYPGAPPLVGNTCLTNFDCALGATCVGAAPTTTGTCVEAVPPSCGNGAADANEECDDGNTSSFDGCSAKCLVEASSCLGFVSSDSAAGAPGPAQPPYFEHFQDNDPIRRSCAGNLNIALGSSSLSLEKGEEVCSQKGDLGLVLPIAVPSALTGVAGADLAANVYPTTVCQQGRFVNGAAPTIRAGTALNKRYALCPDGRVPRGTTWDASNRWAVPVGAGSVSCPVPASSSNDPRCINGKNNKPAISASSFPSAACAVPASGIDGRVFNLHLRTAAGGYHRAPYAGADRELVGAFYRLHTTRTTHGELTAGSNGTCLDGVCCSELDSTRQIGCLVGADNCSIGFAQFDATFATLDAHGLPAQGAHSVSLQGQSASDNLACRSYPANSSLFISTLKGFENVWGAELDLARCFSGAGLSAGSSLTSLLLAHELHPRPTGPSCIDFEGCGDPATNACANNPSGIACQSDVDCSSGSCIVTPEPGGRTKGNCAP